MTVSSETQPEQIWLAKVMLTSASDRVPRQGVGGSALVTIPGWEHCSLGAALSADFPAPVQTIGQYAMSSGNDRCQQDFADKDCSSSPSSEKRAKSCEVLLGYKTTGRDDPSI